MLLQLNSRTTVWSALVAPTLAVWTVMACATRPLKKQQNASQKRMNSKMRELHFCHMKKPKDFCNIWPLQKKRMAQAEAAVAKSPRNCPAIEHSVPNACPAILVQLSEHMGVCRRMCLQFVPETMIQCSNPSHLVPPQSTLAPLLFILWCASIPPAKSAAEPRKLPVCLKHETTPPSPRPSIPDQLTVPPVAAPASSFLEEHVKIGTAGAVFNQQWPTWIALRAELWDFQA